MSKATWERLLLCGGLLLVVSSAQADDEVTHRLTKFGKLSGGEAHRISQTVSGRMKRAADMTSDNDPLRMAVSNALYGSPVSKDAMAAAKIRLRLYAGLNEWALDNLFAAHSGSMATCTTQFGLGKRDCQALIAAGGRVSLAEANKLGAGAPVVMAQAPAPRTAQPAFGQGAQQSAQQSRFGGYNSGYVAQAPRAAQPAYGAPARPAAYAAAPAARPVAAYGAPARPMQPAAAPVMAAPPPSAASVAQRKAEYERQRQAYLERKKQEMAARKAKVVETAGGTERVARGPATEDEAAVMGVAPTAAAKAAAPAKAEASAAEAAPADEGSVASAEPAPSEKPALDNGFLDGLLGDPLGKK